MPEKRTIKRARRDQRQGKSPNTQAGEFVREEIEHIRAGKHGARSTKQAIAIGLSKARRAGVKLRLPKVGTVSEKTRRSAELAAAAGAHPKSPVSRTRSRAIIDALKHEGSGAVSPQALALHAKAAAKRRTAAQRSAAAVMAARTRARSRSTM
jgi:hypothetical protein